MFCFLYFRLKSEANMIQFGGSMQTRVSLVHQMLPEHEKMHCHDFQSFPVTFR
jgi:hypothetical protein